MTCIPVLEGHRLWAEHYDVYPNPILALEQRTVTSLLSRFAPSRALDVACGTGRWMRQFEERGVLAFGVDFCDAMLLQAARHESIRGRLAIGDVAHLPFCDGAADLLLCSMAVGYFPSLCQSFSEFARVTSPQGCVILSDLHPTAIAAGWTRSFRIGNTRFEIDHYAYGIDEIEYAASRAGLHAVLSQDVYLGEPERHFFMRADNGPAFTTATALPALMLRAWKL